jgi:hypothetical protein
MTSRAPENFIDSLLSAIGVAQPSRRLMQGIQFNAARRFRRTWYRVERYVSLLAAAIRHDGITAVNYFVRLNEYSIRSHVCAVLKANTGQPAPALGRVHPPRVRYFKPVVGADVLE